MAQAALIDQEEMCTNFSFPSHGNKILQSLNKQRLDSSLCDVTITVQGQQYKAHKSVLAAYSPYFHGMFTVNWLSSEGDLVMELDGVTSRAFDSLLKLIYTSVLTVSPAIISEVVSAATYLDMPDVVAVCNQYMDKNLALKTAAARKDYSTGPAGLEVGDSDDDDDVDTEPAIFANAEDDWTVNLQDISSAARTGEAGMKPAGAEETVSEPPKPKKKRRWKDEHGSFQCETCGKLYTSRASYRQHMYGHRSGKKHTCMAARPKGVKAVVKLKKKKEKKWRSRTLDPVDGSKVACTCGAFPGYDKEYLDRCGSGRCPCYRQYKTCGPKCICKHCINVVAVAKPAEVDPAKTCSCGKNDKKKGASVVRCSMNVRCACFKSSRPCGRYCRCVNCGNKGDSLNTTEQGPPNGEASLVEKDVKTPKLFAKPLDRRKVRAMKGSVAEMLGQMRTSGTTFQKGSSERNTASRESTTGKEDQTRRAEKSLSVQMSKTTEEQAGQDSRNARTIDTTAAEVASAVASIQTQADSVNPLPAGQVPLIHSQAPAAPKDLSAQGKGCICGKGDKKLGEKSSVQRCSLNLKCSCFKEGRPCGSHCNCFNCGNRADGSDTSAPTNGDTSLVKEGLKPKLFRKQQDVGTRGSKVAKGSVKAMLAKMRTSGATGQKDTTSNTAESATEVASAVAGIQYSSQGQTESVVRPLPAVPIPVLPSQAPSTLGGTLKWVCLPDGSVVSPVKVTGTVRFVGSGNNNATALPSNSGPQPLGSNTAAITDTSDSQHTQKTSEANDKSREEQTVDQDTMDVENMSPGAANASSSDDEGMDQGSPTLDQNTETEGDNDKEASLDKGPKESTAEESQPEDRQQGSGSKRRLKKTVRAGRKRPSPTQSLQPTIVLRRLNLRSGRVNVKEIETMEENAFSKTSSPSKSSASVGATSADTRESGDSEPHPSKKLNKGKAPKATKRPRKSKPQKIGQEAAKEAATEAGPESEADAATTLEAQDDASTWSSRLRKDRKRTWKTSSAEWIADDSGGELSDDSLEKDYTADSDVSSSSSEDVAAIEEEEESEERWLEHRKKVLKKMQGSGKKKVKRNTIGDLLEKGENPKKSLRDAVLEQEGRQGRPRKPKATTVRSRLKKATPIRELLKLQSPEQGPKEIPSWLEEWKKSLSPGTKHTPGGGKGATNKIAEGGEGSTSTVSVQGSSSSTVPVGQSDQAQSGGLTTQDQVAPNAQTGDGRSTAQLQTVSVEQRDQTQASGGGLSTQEHGVPHSGTGDGQRSTAHLQTVSVGQSDQAHASGGPSTQDQITHHSGTGDGQRSTAHLQTVFVQQRDQAHASGGLTTQDQAAPHSGTGDGQSTAHQQAVSVGQSDQAHASGSGPSTQDQVAPNVLTGDGQSTAHLQAVSVGQMDQVQSGSGTSTQDRVVPHSGTGDDPGSC